MNKPKIAAFRNKITLLKSVATVDDELNRIETLQKTKTVWAAVSVKSSMIETTPAGHKAVLKYIFIVRNQKLDFDHVLFNNKIMSLLCPFYEMDKDYAVIEAEETVKKTCNIREFVDGGISNENSGCGQECCSSIV